MKTDLVFYFPWCDLLTWLHWSQLHAFGARGGYDHKPSFYGFIPSPACGPIGLALDGHDLYRADL